LIIQPSEEADGDRSVRWVGEKVAELARLRRRRLIVQPSEEAEGNRSVRWVGEKVAELARLPWVSKRASAQPCKGLHAVCAGLRR